MEDLKPEEEWEPVFDSLTCRCWVILVLLWILQWRSVMSQIHDIHDILCREGKGDELSHQDDQPSLAATDEVLDDEQQVDDRYEVGLQNEGYHQYQQDESLEDELNSLVEAHFVLEVNGFLQHLLIELDLVVPKHRNRFMVDFRLESFMMDLHVAP